MYSSTSSGSPNIVSEWQVSQPIATLESERQVLSIAQPAGNHNGGTLVFSPLDGYLYITLGDGGSYNDQFDRGQTIDEMLGKVLRIDVDSRTHGALNDNALFSIYYFYNTKTIGAYGVPSSNPHFDNSSYLPEIFVLGVRNPWRCTFDRAAPSQLYCGDVGQGAWEELDVINTTAVVASKTSNLGAQLLMFCVKKKRE
jgi:glucose/arabinose dehydrogenase